MISLAEFLEAVKAGEAAKVQAMLAQEPSLATTRDGEGVSAILLSVFHRHPEVTRVLLESGPVLDLFEAATLGSLAWVQKLLSIDRSHLQTFTSQGFTALGLAAFFGHQEVVAYLLDRGAAIDTVDRSFNANTALDAAVAGNHTDTALLLLAGGAKVMVRDKAQNTPLHKAAHHANLRLMRALLERGADPRSLNAKGQTPGQLVPEGHAEAHALLAEK